MNNKTNGNNDQDSEIQKKGDILIVDDQIENIQFLSDILTDYGYEVRRVLSGKHALKVINYDPPELLLLDIMMPEIDGYEICRQVKNNPKTSKIPIIFLSAKQLLSEKIKGFKVGGVDYITKPFLVAEVICRIDTHLKIYHYQNLLNEQIVARKKVEQELLIANEKLKQFANIDSLTEVYNRRYFDDLLSKEWYRLRREKQPLSVIMIDIDCFKEYNDTYGHLRGDEVLRAIALAVKSSLKRPSDFIARYGGEEFVVVLPNTNLEGCVIICEYIVQKIRELAIPHKGSITSKYVTVSMGVCSLIPSEDLDPYILVNQSDNALYRAKEEGRNCFRLSQFNLAGYLNKFS